jgi:hypothetical protein
MLGLDATVDKQVGPEGWDFHWPSPGPQRLWLTFREGLIGEQDALAEQVERSALGVR